MIYIILGVFVLILDIITKYWAETVLKGTSGIALIDRVFHFTYVENPGVAFGLLPNMRAVFITLSVLIIAVLLVYYIRTNEKSTWLKLGTSLILCGSAGNLIERIFKGYVVDFLDFRLVNFPVFNIADIAVCTGAAALVIHFLLLDGGKDGAGEKNR
ncbi:MAG TPA: signal peptidase II [Candidatus Monoglobus merdigallinarum]|uniref:Lipoprotein signal peptidase n=1 Tax=Candidatus Monoglobus merdigallinarum TaxID=2838698 RepID=A0A9D1PPH2_9FIRM|nr:signal peptidase II [Candidatus Monoglobus merdigallinarum]